MEVAWDAYARKAPRTQAAGPEFADPGYDMSVEWLAAREAINTAEKAHTDPSLPTRKSDRHAAIALREAVGAVEGRRPSAKVDASRSATQVNDVGCNSEAYCTDFGRNSTNGAIRLTPIAPYKALTRRGAHAIFQCERPLDKAPA